MIVEATILCAEGERRSLNLDLVALNTAAWAKFDNKPSGLGDFTKLNSVLGCFGFVQGMSTNTCSVKENY